MGEELLCFSNFNIHEDQLKILLKEKQTNATSWVPYPEIQNLHFKQTPETISPITEPWIVLGDPLN